MAKDPWRLRDGAALPQAYSGWDSYLMDNRSAQGARQLQFRLRHSHAGATRSFEPRPKLPVTLTTVHASTRERAQRRRPRHSAATASAEADHGAGRRSRHNRGCEAIGTTMPPRIAPSAIDENGAREI